MFRKKNKTPKIGAWYNPMYEVVFEAAATKIAHTMEEQNRECLDFPFGPGQIRLIRYQNWCMITYFTYKYSPWQQRYISTIVQKEHTPTEALEYGLMRPRTFGENSTHNLTVKFSDLADEELKELSGTLTDIFNLMASDDPFILPFLDCFFKIEKKGIGVVSYDGLTNNGMFSVRVERNGMTDDDMYQFLCATSQNHSWNFEL